jgi:hypothetical protein
MLALVVTVALDMRAHSRVEDLGGVNVWGYRGPVMAHKQPNEIRIAAAGGDLAFGWGVAAAETLPYFVRRLIALDFANNRVPISLSAVNLAARGLDASEYADWMSRFAYLQPDIVCVLPDPDGHAPSDATFLPDRQSWFFHRFGYSPILPLVVAEKAAVLRSPALRAAAGVLEWLDPRSPIERTPAGQPGDGLDRAVDAARMMAAIGVVVLVPPGVAPPPLAASRDPRIRTVDLRDAPVMDDPSLRLDGFSFSVAGHSSVADLVAPAVLDLIRSRNRTG